MLDIQISAPLMEIYRYLNQKNSFWEDVASGFFPDKQRAKSSHVKNVKKSWEKSFASTVSMEKNEKKSL